MFILKICFKSFFGLLSTTAAMFLTVFCSFQLICRLFCSSHVMQKQTMGEVEKPNGPLISVVSKIFVPKILKLDNPSSSYNR